MHVGQCMHGRTHRANYASSKMSKMLGFGTTVSVGIVTSVSRGVGACVIGSDAVGSVSTVVL